MGHFQPTSASAGGSGFWLFSAWPSSPWASLKPKQTQLPIQRLILILFIEATTVLDITMEATGMVATLTTATTARDLLKLSLPPPLRLTLRLELTPGTDTMDADMVLDTMVDTMVDTMGDTMVDTTAITARDLLMLSPLLPPLLMPRLTHMCCMDTMVLVTTATTARDLLRLSPLLPPLLMPRLMLIPGMDTTVDLDTTAMAAMAMAMVTTWASKKCTSNPELASMKCQHFWRRPAKCSQLQRRIKMYKTSSFFKHTAFKHLYILDFGIFAYLLRPLEPQERTRNEWFKC